MARVAFVLPSFIGGGAERVALNLIRDFAALGHSVDLLLMKAEGELLALLPGPVRVIDLKAARIRDALGPLRRYLRKEKPDAVQASMWPLTVVAIAAHRLSRSDARLVTSEHTILSRQYSHYGAVRRAAMTRILHHLLPRANARVAVSGAAADDLARLSRLPRAMIDVIYNPLEMPAVIASNEETETLWGDAGPRILTVGSLKPVKNFPLLLDAFARVSDKSARLMIVGEGALRPDLERLADDLAIADRVVMPGFFADPWPFFASADLFVLSSDYEGFGNVLVEALAAGRRIVSTDCSGGAEVLDHGRFGRVVPCGDPVALARAIDEALTEEPMPERQRARALELSGPGCAARYLELMLPQPAGAE
jgi:glycosyltransferase involved in cell wall biosynthesis